MESTVEQISYEEFYSICYKVNSNYGPTSLGSPEAIEDRQLNVLDRIRREVCKDYSLEYAVRDIDNILYTINRDGMIYLRDLYGYLADRNMLISKPKVDPEKAKAEAYNKFLDKVRNTVGSCVMYNNSLWIQWEDRVQKPISMDYIIDELISGLGVDLSFTDMKAISKEVEQTRVYLNRKTLALPVIFNLIYPNKWNPS